MSNCPLLVAVGGLLYKVLTQCSHTSSNSSSLYGNKVLNSQVSNLNDGTIGE